MRAEHSPSLNAAVTRALSFTMPVSVLFAIPKLRAISVFVSLPALTSDKISAFLESSIGFRCTLGLLAIFNETSEANKAHGIENVRSQAWRRERTRFLGDGDGSDGEVGEEKEHPRGESCGCTTRAHMFPLRNGIGHESCSLRE
ncbi:hypothetical protein MRX96_001011 [Rhipicephalus microplus]